MRRFVQAAGRFMAAEVIIAVVLALSLAPLMFSPIRSFEMTFFTPSIVPGSSWTIDERFDTDSGLRSLACSAGLEQVADIPSTPLHCRFVASEILDATDYLQANGVVTDFRYHNVSIQPLWDVRLQGAWSLLLGAAVWAVWLRVERRSPGQEWAGARLGEASSWGLMLLPFACGMSLVMACQMIWPMPVSASANVQSVGWVAVMAVMGAPVLEEALFRGLFVQVTSAHMPRWVVAVSGSAVFTGFHGAVGGAGWQLLIFAVFSMLMYWLWFRRGSLLLCVIAHMLYNGLQLLYHLAVQ